jgi:16S rRNA (cytidine1402-2'-O)-methyltransferase
MLILGATPIGCPEDASSRLAKALSTADVIAAEDTRRAKTLAASLGVKISGRLVSLHDHNEAQRTQSLAQAVLDGQDVLVVSDAGMPMINDPGFKLSAAVVAAGGDVTCLPGPSAPLAALVLSGLPTHRFAFEGFLPPKSGSRQNALTRLKDEERTMIFLESKHRIAKTLQDMSTIFGPTRKAALARELTKPHEEIIRDTLDALASLSVSHELKGEMCIVVAGA